MDWNQLIKPGSFSPVRALAVLALPQAQQGMPLCLCTFCFLCLAPATTPGLSLPIPQESRQVMATVTVNPEVLALFLAVFHALYHPSVPADVT